MQFEYKALNLFDEISVVEVTLDSTNSCIHLFDRDGALYPQYNFSMQQHEPNDEFWKMKETIEQKHLAKTFFDEKEEETKWIFYTPKKDIYCITTSKDKFYVEKIYKVDRICLSNYVNRLQICALGV